MDQAEREAKAHRDNAVAIVDAMRHNAQLMPEVPGRVRVDGPRRQSRLVVNDNGSLTSIEI